MEDVKHNIKHNSLGINRTQAVFFCLCILIVMAGMWMIFHFGIRPKAIRIIKPSYFTSKEEAGQLLHQVLYPRLGLHKVVVYGKPINTVGYDGLLSGYLSAAQVSDRPFDVVAVVGAQVDFKTELKDAVIMDIAYGGELLKQMLEPMLVQGKRVLIVMNLLDATHFTGQNQEIIQIEQWSKEKVPSILALPIGITEEEQLKVAVGECLVPDENAHTLPCVHQRQYKALQREKKVKWEKVILIMNQEGERDFVTYLHEPTKAL